MFQSHATVREVENMRLPATPCIVVIGKSICMNMVEGNAEKVRRVSANIRG